MAKSYFNILMLICIVLFNACNNTTKTPETQNVEVSETFTNDLPKLKRDPRTIGPEKSNSQKLIEQNIYQIKTSDHPLFGYWVGAFGKNKINLAIADIVGDSIFGHSVCAGNFRPVRGVVRKLSDQQYEIRMQEPGDDKYDGEFNFKIDLQTDKLEGKWKPYKNTVGAKEYTLSKKKYEYNPNNGDFPETSTTRLDPEYAMNLLPEEIEIRRNMIYARHGYSFQNIRIRRIFDEKDWYIPMSIDIRDELTDIEVFNIDMLYNYEDYYAEYYDDFGR